MDKHFCPYCMSPVPEGEICPVCGLTAGNYVPSPHHLPPGTVLMDRYLVGRVLGEGGFGITYIGCDLRLEMKVAIKEYYPVDRATRNASVSAEVTSFMGAAAKSYERGKQKFLEEARIMAKMDKQQAIVSVRDFFETNNTVYIVMEYVEGITLKELVEKKGGRIAPEELFPMLEPLFKALSMFHETGLIHRDISPDNLMLEDGKIRLLDFGCAREAGGGKETLTIALKHGYAPLEQYRQKGQGPWTDIYALCATIYYCLVGKAPPQALDRIGEDTLLLPTKLGVHLTEQEERALLKGLRIQPRRRFQTVAELHAALYEDAPVEDEEPEQVMPAVAPPVVPGPEVSGLTVDVSQEAVPLSEEGAEAQEPEGEVESQPGEQPEGRKGVVSRTGYLVGLGVLGLMIVTLLGLFVFPGRDGESPADGENVPAAEEAAEPDDTGVFVMDWSRGHEPDDLPKAFENKDITSVVIPAGQSADWNLHELNVTKPLHIEQGASLRCNNVILTGNGQLQVDGEFEASYLRLEGDTVFHASASAELWLDSRVIWADRDEQLQLDDPALSSNIRSTANYIILDSEGRDAVSVTSAEELEQFSNDGINTGKMLSINADISLDGDFAISQPMRISEGVTFSISGNLVLDQGGALLNCGTLNGGYLYTNQGAPLVNLGQLGSREDPLQFWFEGNSTVINGGTAWFNDVSRLWLGHFLNLNGGTIGADDLIMVNSTLDNDGVVQALSGSSGLMLASGGRLFNYGTLTVQSDSQLRNYGYIENYGQISWGANSRIFNCCLENQGSLTASSECHIDQLGALYGSGEFINMDDLPYLRVRGDIDWSEAVRVSNADDLLIQLNKDAGDILVEGEVIADLNKDYELTEGRTLFIEGDLVLNGPGTLTVTGGRLYLIGEMGRLDMLTDITLRENGEMRMEGGSEFGGVATLTLDHSVFWGWDGIFNTGGATVRLQNQAVFAPGALNSIQGGSAFSVSGGSVFVLPWMADNWLYQTSFTVEDPESELIHLGVCSMMECTLDIQGQFLTCGWDLEMEDCQMTIGQEGSDNGRFDVFVSNMTIHGDSSVTNWGSIGLDSWDEFGLNLNYNDPEGLVNYGDIWVNMRSYFGNNSAGIRNEGHMDISARMGFDTSRITGSGPVEFS